MSTPVLPAIVHAGHGALLICGLLLTGVAWAQAALPLEVFEGSRETVTVAAKAGDQVLQIEGRYVLWVEHRVLSGIRLRLNGKEIEGAARILGPDTVYLPTRTINWEEYPLPRYSPSGYAFPADTDYIQGNGPFRNGRDASCVVECPHLLQLDVKDVLKPGSNTLVITNSADQAFEVRRLACAPKPETVEDPFFTYPSWKYLSYSQSARERYRKVAAKEGVSADQRAYLLAALGTAEVLREGGKREVAMADCELALKTSATFYMRGEAAYRLATERLLSGRWPTPESEALARATVKGSRESWGELTLALLDVIDGKTESAARPLITPAFTSTSPKPDGVLDEPCWQTAKPYPLEAPLGYSSIKTSGTTVRFAVTQDGLAVAYEGAVPAQTRWTTGDGRDVSVWEDNCVEFFITPDVDMRVYHEFGVTPKGARFDARNLWWWNLHPEWNGAWRVGNRLDGTRFAIEMMIPWTDLDLRERPKSGHVVIITCARGIVDTAGYRKTTAFFTLTRHRDYDCHRLMDGALLIMP